MAKASTKRKSPSPTADDLMRMAESLPRKRQKLTARYDDEDEDVDVEARSAATSGDDDDDDENSEHSDDSTPLKPILANEEDSDDEESAFSRLPARIAAKRASSPVPTGPAKTAQNTGFGALGVSQQLITALSAMSIRQPTDVQAACIPPLLAGKNSCYYPAVHRLNFGLFGQARIA